MIQNNQEKGFRYSIRKQRVGVCSVVIVAFLLSAGAIIEANTVKATETTVSSSNLKRNGPKFSY